MLDIIMLPIISIGGLSLIFGAILGFSAKKFAVHTDPMVLRVLDVLPGVNCGGCGYPGCGVFAARVVEETAEYNGCPAAGTTATAEIAKILGIDAAVSIKKVAYVKCAGTDENIMRNYIYDGPKSCVAASQLATGGNKACSFSCIGHASCQNVCPFGAIKMVDSVAVINNDKCTGCGKCISVCPKNLIEMGPVSAKLRVMCNSKDKGAIVRKICRAGCLGCKICQKACKEEAIVIENNVARIDSSKCTSCMECLEKCPTKAIRVLY